MAGENETGVLQWLLEYSSKHKFSNLTTQIKTRLDNRKVALNREYDVRLAIMFVCDVVHNRKVDSYELAANIVEFLFSHNSAVFVGTKFVNFVVALKIKPTRLTKKLCETIAKFRKFFWPLLMNKASLKDFVDNEYERDFGGDYEEGLCIYATWFASCLPLTKIERILSSTIVATDHSKWGVAVELLLDYCHGKQELSPTDICELVAALCAERVSVPHGNFTVNTSDDSLLSNLRSSIEDSRTDNSSMTVISPSLLAPDSSESSVKGIVRKIKAPLVTHPDIDSHQDDTVTSSYETGRCSSSGASEHNENETRGVDDCNIGNDDCNIGNDDCNIGNDDCNIGNDDCNIGNDDCNIGNDDCNIGNDDCNIGNDDCDAGNDDCDAGKDDCDAGKDDCDAGKDDCDAGKDDCDAGKDDCDAGKDDCHAGNADCHAGNADCHAGSDDCHAGNDDCYARNDDCHAGKDDCHAGKDDCHAGNDDCYAGNDDCDEGNDDCDAGNADGNSGNADMRHGRKRFHEGEHSGPYRKRIVICNENARKGLEDMVNDKDGLNVDDGRTCVNGNTVRDDTVRCGVEDRENGDEAIEGEVIMEEGCCEYNRVICDTSDEHKDEDNCSELEIYGENMSALGVTPSPRYDVEGSELLAEHGSVGSDHDCEGDNPGGMCVTQEQPCSSFPHSKNGCSKKDDESVVHGERDVGATYVDTPDVDMLYDDTPCVYMLYDNTPSVYTPYVDDRQDDDDVNEPLQESWHDSNDCGGEGSDGEYAESLRAETEDDAASVESFVTCDSGSDVVAGVVDRYESISGASCDMVDSSTTSRDILDKTVVESFTKDVSTSISHHHVPHITPCLVSLHRNQELDMCRYSKTRKLQLFS